MLWKDYTESSLFIQQQHLKKKLSKSWGAIQEAIPFLDSFIISCLQGPALFAFLPWIPLIINCDVDSAFCDGALTQP